ncbi:MAG TPA: hypothetical protein DEW46_14930, partial [Verrucomicrobia bacterium]|nr:hypothetical protein [Verrucomicrobiota bacterium]
MIFRPVLSFLFAHHGLYPKLDQPPAGRPVQQHLDRWATVPQMLDAQASLINDILPGLFQDRLDLPRLFRRQTIQKLIGGSDVEPSPGPRPLLTIRVDERQLLALARTIESKI